MEHSLVNPTLFCLVIKHWTLMLYCLHICSYAFQVFNDPIHGHIELHPLLVRIIDTPEFQRLRYIKQLGGIYYVYPGASHNRFEHSIGVGHLAGCLARELRDRQPELNITDTDILCVQIAGLCHDLGKYQFLVWHEDLSIKMFDHLIESNHLKAELSDQEITEPDLTFIKELIMGCPLSDKLKLDPWPYEGRPVEKMFLYQIVANKENGIDVDKFDYLARDCYHLGIQNSFDYKRFLKFARVCDVGNRKHICVRDKEVWNLYNMFYTRYGLYRRTCHHRVVNVIEIMIGEAFGKADKYFKIKGSKVKVDSEVKVELLTISGAVNDMVAYTKLTDAIFLQILYSSDPNLSAAKEILEKIVHRKFYSYLGEATSNPTSKQTPVYILLKSLNDSLSGELATAVKRGDPNLRCTEEDFVVDVFVLDYGMKEKNPIDKVYFYSKNNPREAFNIRREEVSYLLLVNFSEQIIRAYCKKTDDDNMLKAAKNGFMQLCQDKGFSIRQVCASSVTKTSDVFGCIKTKYNAKQPSVGCQST
uniref:HD domain-containing protein n=1 Tax=Xenopus tropicalis TaxID=8364 RepID=A0A6I8QGK3_XENTR